MTILLFDSFVLLDFRDEALGELFLSNSYLYVFIGVTEHNIIENRIMAPIFVSMYDVCGRPLTTTLRIRNGRDAMTLLQIILCLINRRIPSRNYNSTCLYWQISIKPASFFVRQKCMQNWSQSIGAQGHPSGLKIYCHGEHSTGKTVLGCKSMR